MDKIISKPKKGVKAKVSTQDDGLRVVGKSVQRIDGWEKIRGAAKYTDDLEFGPGLLYAALVESPHAHARIKSIDTAAAEKLRGVVKVVTGRNFVHKFGLYMNDRYIFANDVVRFVGEQVAAVVATDAKTALRGAALVKVVYEELPAVMDPVKALEKDSPLVHPDLKNYPHVPWFFPKPGTNIAHWRKIRKGDLAKGFKDADLVMEDTYTVPRYAHCAIENHSAIGLYDASGRLTMWTSSQSPFTQRHVFAETLKSFGIAHKDVRVVSTYIGGGFGGKAGVTMEIIAAALAIAVPGRPVKLLWGRAQEFYNTYQRLGVTAKIKMGATKAGKITALDFKLHWDSGAYVEYGANVVNAAGLSASGPYRVDNLSVDSMCTYTNLPPCGAYRGFGYSEFLFGLESHITRMAEKLGIDPVEFRKRNAIKEGETLPYGAHMNPTGIQDAIAKVEKEIKWGVKEKSKDPRKAIGKSVVCFWKSPAMPPNASSSAFLKFNEDGSVNILVSGMDMGQGLLTVMAQVAGEVLALPVTRIRVETPDTDRNPYEWQTVGSHVTWGCGNAVKRAAMEARERIFDLVQRVHCLDRSTLYLEDECVRCRTKPDFRLPYRDFVINGIQADDHTFKGGPIMGSGVFMPEFASAISDPETGQGGHPNVHYTTGAAGVILEVDRETGKMRIKKVALAVDCGKAINPDLVKGQIVGGLLQGFATVLYEDMRYTDKGRLLNPNFSDYKIPTAKDMPDEVVPIIIEVPQPDGPYGARGVGEHTMIPCAPLIANAVSDALEVRIKSMPVTKEKVALAAAGGKNK
ncbi:MAG: xanthine dehydrogenase family protein molybdopterin-binding subunit [Elusimicrobiales bacterium]|nr:xanthine dehydrogenase family protein molybdopterin-binding subunit [Elusimicrobiales bacterium]